MRNNGVTMLSPRHGRHHVHLGRPTKKSVMDMTARQLGNKKLRAIGRKKACNAKWNTQQKEREEKARKKKEEKKQKQRKKRKKAAEDKKNGGATRATGDASPLAPLLALSLPSLSGRFVLFGYGNEPRFVCVFTQY